MAADFLPAWPPEANSFMLFGLLLLAGLIGGRIASRTRVLHHGGASGAGERGSLFVRNIEGRLAFMRRHRGAMQAVIAREIVTLGALWRWGIWRARAWLEGGRPRERTRDQLARFAAVLAWRARGGG